MRPGRALVGLLLVVAVVGAGCGSEVAADLDERQAQEALAALAAAGIPAERDGTGDGRDRRYRIEVPAADAARAAATLRAQGIPRTPEPGFRELYGTASMIPTETEEKARYLSALGGEIARHLERMDEVVDASVIVTAPTADPLAPPDAPRRRPSASVLLKVRPGGAPAEDAIARLVAGSVEGMAPADVTVVVTPAAAVAAAAEPFVRVGPVHVARGSRGALLGLLGGAGAAVILLGGWVVLGERRAARLRRRLAELGR